MFAWDDEPELNITPLVDVMLVLMAILMVTAPTIHYDEQITLPEGSKTKQTESTKTFTLELDANRDVRFNNNSIPLDEFEERTETLLIGDEYSKDETVFMMIDETLPYSDVMKLLSILKKNGYLKVSFVTQ